MFSEQYEMNLIKIKEEYDLKIQGISQEIENFLQNTYLDEVDNDLNECLIEKGMDTFKETQTTACIRAFVAFLANESQTEAILDLYEWECHPEMIPFLTDFSFDDTKIVPGTTIAQIYKKQLFDLKWIHKLLEDPKKFVTKKKMNLIQSFMTKSQDAFDFARLGLYILRLPSYYTEIMETTFSYLRTISNLISIKAIHRIIYFGLIEDQSKNELKLNQNMNGSKRSVSNCSKKPPRPSPKKHSLLSVKKTNKNFCPVVSVKSLSEISKRNRSSERRVSLINQAIKPKSDNSNRRIMFNNRLIINTETHETKRVNF